MNSREPEPIFPDLSSRWAVALIVAMAAGAAALRLSFFADSPFPINDGGLFYAYVRAILDNHLALPATVQFNGFTLPFAYPPLSFWAGALVAALFNIDPLPVVRYYPFAIHFLLIFLYVPLLRALRLPWAAVVLASAVFLFSHRSFEYLIMGGGMSRATGAALTLAALLATTWALRRGGPMPILATALFTALAILSHLEWGIVSALGVTLVFVFYGHSRRDDLRHLALIGALSALIVAPWVGWVLALHGTEPFVTSSATSQWSFAKFAGRVLDLDIFPTYLKILCVIGAWEAFRRGENFWIAFVLLLALLTPRHFGSAAVLPNSVLAAYGFAHLASVAGTALAGFVARLGGAWPALPRPRRAAFAALYPALAIYVAAASSVILSSRVSLGTLSAPAYDAMSWIRDNLPEKSAFAVLAPDPWYVDEVNEWFPVLTRAVSLTTVQGSEWVAGGEFRKRESASISLKKKKDCSAIVGQLLADYATADYVLATYRQDCFAQTSTFRPLYANAAAGVYAIDKSRSSAETSAAR